MAEQPRRRKRPDSSKMWEESENRGPGRDREEKNDRGDRRDDRNRNHERSRRDRSRSPRDSKDNIRSSYRDREREQRNRGGRRDDRDGRGNDRNRDHRDKNDGRSGRRDSHRADVPDRTRGEFMPYALSQTVFTLRGRPNIGKDDVQEPRVKDENENDRKGMFSPDSEQDETLVLAIRTLSNSHKDNERSSGEKSNERVRSRSPRRNDERDYRKDKSSEGTSRSGEYTDDRNVTPQPVSFSIGASHTAIGHDHDRMDIDSGNKKKKSQPKKKIKEEEEDDDIVIEDDGMAAMQAMMGFGGFATTQNKQIPGNNISAVRKEKKTEYRQYMNRVGGFNRPLSPSRD
ncbi:hypothetical protein SBOR_5358 [Sclerotinia borealis F-4128]|uniref:U4/U6.U5 small nuclear ribonucleoprotein 27kDa protein domain-containing protein n=1 Tax=Sclerotinia borealis (strain F-4128) TaxID=1432307 RepID=W9CHM9_SCLBF|nr:hypothetical protein SBOR_5358 [Sclerotinia borealis F-4128]